MLIYLDSSIICSNFFMQGPTFDLMKKIGTIVISQIVFDEVCNKYREWLLEYQKKVRNGLEAANAMLSSPIENPLTSERLENECRKYSDFLEMFVIESGLTIPEPYPTIPHDIVVKRALLRKRPFKDDGSTGYRDFLVWMSCINIAKTYAQEEIHFVSNNVKDFSDQKNKELLHPDLVADLCDAGISEVRFHYWNSANRFISEYAGKIANAIENRAAMISAIMADESSFLIPITDYICSIYGTDLSKWNVYVPGVNPILQKTIDNIGTQIEEFEDVDDCYYIDVIYECIGIVESSIYRDELHEYEQKFDIEVISSNGNMIRINTSLGLKIWMKVKMKKSNKSISSIELVEIEDYYCPFCD